MDRKNIFKSVKPDVDMNHILNNTDAIARNIQQRKGDADVHKVVSFRKVKTIFESNINCLFSCNHV